MNINISVAGVQQLTLIATNGIAGNIDYDHADWAGAALLGVPAAPAAPSNLAASVSAVGQVQSYLDQQRQQSDRLHVGSLDRRSYLYAGHNEHRGWRHKLYRRGIGRLAALLLSTLRHQCRWAIAGLQHRNRHDTCREHGNNLSQRSASTN